MTAGAGVSAAAPSGTYSLAWTVAPTSVVKVISWVDTVPQLVWIMWPTAAVMIMRAMHTASTMAEALTRMGDW